MGGKNNFKTHIRVKKKEEFIEIKKNTASTVAWPPDDQGVPTLSTWLYLFL